jgi:hypothetical protein
VANTLISRIKRHRKGELLTPLIDEFYRKSSVSGGVQFTPRTMEILTDNFLTPDRDRRGSFSASGLAACMRAQVLNYNHQDQFAIPNERREAIFFNGHWLHLKWGGILLEMGVLKYENGVPCLEVGVSIPEWRVEGTLDAICELEGEDWLVDVKGVGMHYWQMMKGGDIPRAYLWQQQAYMKAKGINLAMLLVENKATGEYIEIHLPPPDSMVALQMEARVKALNWHIEQRKLPPVLDDYPRNRDCQDCPFQLDCPTAVFDDTPELPL